MARIETQITINRPIEGVFAYVSDIRNNLKWQTGVISAEITSAGPIGVGTTFKFEIEVMGRKLETTGELTAHDPPKVTAWKGITGPFPMSGSTTFKSAEGGTLVTDVLEAEPGGFFKLAIPLLIKQQKAQMEADMKKLKELLEK